MSRESNVRNLRIEWLSIAELKLDARNPRIHGDRQIGLIGRSIDIFGFNVPILIDSNNTVIAGHGRVLAAEKQGLQDVPATRLGHLTAQQAKAFRIADNRLTEISTWNDQLLGEILSELAAVELDFSLEATGFSMGEIDLRIEGLVAATEVPRDAADGLPEVFDQSPVTRPGDLWLMRGHRVLCGDALESASYLALMQEVLADLVFTDPPYNVPIDGHVSGKGRIHHREFAMASGEMTADEFTTFLTAAFHLLAEHSCNGSIQFVCMDWRHMLEILMAGKRAYTDLKNVCVWVKDNAGMGSLYRSQHELIFVFKNGRAVHRNNVQLGQFGRNRTNVWQYPSAHNFGRKGEEGNLLAVHPTVKPVQQVADAIMDCSARGDIVLDPFLGSGSTLIAAERVGRLCYGIEIDPLYVDAAVRRWQRHAGESAIHAKSGKCFDEVEGEARHV